MFLFFVEVARGEGEQGDERCKEGEEGVVHGRIVGDKVFIEMSALSIRSWEVCAGGRPHRRGWVRGWARGSFSGWKSGVAF